MQSAKKRELCYETRDAFHKCLDTLPEDPEKECAAQKKLFEQSCPKSWVSYFEKQREREVILQLQVEQYKRR
ncbi:Cytochrome_oxidase_c_subunit_VIb [Leishmania major strain Friedlin]|nr:Cytochrome_oxidase_c_subunit_VIb [Leishmania major strain Friedlin]